MECTGTLFDLHRNNLQKGRIFHNSRMISTTHQHQRSNSFQDSTVLSIRFEVVKCMSVHEDAKPV